MSTPSDWTCACRAVNSSASVWCEACGTERPDRAGRTLRVTPKVQETHAPWHAPTYSEPTAEDDVLIRAELAKIKALLWGDGPPKRRLDLPAIDPAIRAHLERRP